MARDCIRIGLVGLGQRGMATLRRYQVVEDATVVAISDLRSEAVEEARQMLGPNRTKDGRPIEAFAGADQWRLLCRQADVDLVIICTDWASHAAMAIYAMQQGKDVAIEVPAAMTVEECWQLVDTAERTGCCCTMLENCCYDTFHLGVMGMVRRGLFGDIGHCEGAYIHDLRTNRGWMGYTVGRHGGNPYPTHGLGPVCQVLGIHRGDRLQSLVSLTAPNNINNALIRTARGRTILLQFDERTPRPYSRLQTLCGTRGYAQKYPRPTLQIDGQPPRYDEEAEAAVAQYHDEETRVLIREGNRLGVTNLMNYIMDRRLIGALREGRRPDITVYDAALWSCVAELSARSAALGGQPVEIPDFTHGGWEQADV